MINLFRSLSSFLLTTVILSCELGGAFYIVEYKDPYYSYTSMRFDSISGDSILRKEREFFVSNYQSISIEAYGDSLMCDCYQEGYSICHLSFHSVPWWVVSGNDGGVTGTWDASAELIASFGNSFPNERVYYYNGLIRFN